MPINAKTAGGSTGGGFTRQEALDAGTYPCRIVQATYFGLQEQRAYKGTPKEPRDDLGYTYEFLDEFCLDADGNEDKTKPRWLSEIFPVHNMAVENATSTKRLKVIDPEDDLSGDFLLAVNTPVMVTIVKNTKEDTARNYVASISAMRGKDVASAPELVNPATVFDVDEPDMDIFNKFPTWLQDKLKSNLGYNGSALERLVGGGSAPVSGGAATKKQEVVKDDPADGGEDW